MTPATESHLSDPADTSSGEDRYAALQRGLRSDPVFFFENLLKIVDKNGELIAFAPNEQQRKLLNIVMAMRKAGLPVRIICLKARQLGFSTCIEGLAFQEASMNPYRRVRIVAHKDDSTRNLFEMSRLFYRELHQKVRPAVKYSSKTELDFQNPKDDPDNPGLRSWIRVATAGGDGIGRSDTLQFLHLSEVAFWDNAATVATALSQAVPLMPNTHVFIESTANGVGGYFHDQYWKHKDGKEALLEMIDRDWRDVEKLTNHLLNFKGTIGYLPLFFPWHEFPEYTLPLTEGEEEWFLGSLSPEERELRSRFDLTLGQLKWRRHKIEELAEDAEGAQPEDLFRQEFPMTDKEAFISRGRNYFSSTALDKMPVKPPKHRWQLLGGEGRLEYTGKMGAPEHTDSPYGEFSVWNPPKKDGQYIVSCDVSDGVGQDRSVMQIINKKTLEQEAEYVSDRVRPDVFGRLAVHVASWYNEALLAIEWNQSGSATVIAARDTDYPNVYFREPGYEKIHDVPSDMWGFKTTQATKPVALAEMRKHISQGNVLFHSQGLIQECREYMIEFSKTGTAVKYTAPEGKHDDRVMAMAIGLQVYKEHPYEYKDYPQETRLYDEREVSTLMEQEYTDDPLGDL